MSNFVQLYGLPSRYVFDRSVGCFRDLRSGQFVAHAQIMWLVQDRIEYHQQQLEVLTQALVDSRITLAQWERTFAEQLKDMHLQQAALARGGWQNMTQADFGRVGRVLREQYKYLHRFALDIEAGKHLNVQGQPPLTKAEILARARLYAISGRESYWRAANVTAEKAGLKFERRLARGDSSTCSPCVDLARRGWVPIGTLPPPGGPPCLGLNHCRCEKEYR